MLNLYQLSVTIKTDKNVKMNLKKIFSFVMFQIIFI